MPAPAPEPEPADTQAPDAAPMAAPSDEPETATAAPVKAEANPLLAQGEVKVEKRPKEIAFKPAPERQQGNLILAMGKSPDVRAISDNGPKYTGKRISLNFKDADLKDVFRLFHEITGYNIVLDPAVAGSLTIVLENVPEDQALDIILKNNGLDKVFDNNVVRIASTRSWPPRRRRGILIEAQGSSRAGHLHAQLSYAKSKDVVPIIKKIMSKRGDVIMDDRTNT
jgi:type IV pilus assembly protein PilQ